MSSSDVESAAPVIRPVAGRLRSALGPLVGVALFAAALAVLHRELQAYHYRDVVAGLHTLPRWRVGAALAATVASYLTLTGYDVLALRYAGRALEYRRTALASFVGYAFSHNVGLAFLSGGAVRFRLYSTWGLSTSEIASVIGFNIFTFWLGFLILSAAAFIAEPAALAALLPGTGGARPLVAGLALTAVAGYLAWSAAGRSPLRWRGWEVRVPPLRLATAQVALSALDWLLAASVPFLLLPQAGGLGFGAFLGAFLVAQLAGLASHLPGGVGVFETAMVLLLAPFLPGATVLGSLVAYRLIYYLLPLLIAGVLLGAHELGGRRAGLGRIGRVVGRWLPAVVPQALTVTTFLAGIVLLASGATPALHGRLGFLGRFLPLALLELSHFLGSVVGVALLLLARGVQRRLDAAYHLTAALLVAGIGFSLLKGFDYEEATVLGLMLAALLPCRRYFYRRASLLDEPLTGGWVAAILLVFVGAVWLLLLSHRSVEYANELWWQFELSANAPRSLRATTGAFVLLASYGMARLLRPAAPEPALPTDADLARTAAVVAQSPRTTAHLALLGDKDLLFNERGDAFLMYGVEGRSWVAMGDPVGPPREARELAWRFHELSDRHGGWTVFYEVGPENLPLYLDLGLSPIKLGEEARVPLASFSLEGGARKGLRQTHRRAAQTGCSLEVVPPSAVAPLMDELRRVSDAWLAEKHAREKGFSLGFFSPSYLERLPLAVVRCGGRVVAFANLWLGAAHEELSIDLMRYDAGAPPGVMDYLFVELLLWSRDAGYRWFNLGMAPLSGLEERALAPLWTRLGAFLFRHGEHFYNFQGLRQYKDKFDPVWAPRYLASPGGLALPRILAHLAALIARGLPGVVTK